MIYTGYFAQVKKYRDAGLVTLSIARSARYYSGERFPVLAPPVEIINLSEDDYIPRYFTCVLNKLNPLIIAEELKKYGENIVLLCHEKPSSFCHRQLVAGWLKDAGIHCEEFVVEKEKKQSLEFV